MDRSGRRYTQFKNFKEYTKNVNKNDKLSAAYEKIKSSTRSNNELKSKVNEVLINEDWVIAIETYLPYISKAINENRKFIRSQSETLPVEKAKKVTKDSIINLSMNSQNIRKINENNEIEPAKLLIVEKLDDYSIYENKFLVYLLKMLKTFIEIRFDKIKTAKSVYESDTKLGDTVNLYRNKITYNIEIKDERFGDLNLEENDASANLIGRIQNLQVLISQLQRTELIEEVSKTPSIKLPIQRTNLLKNDVNFSKALKLYDFIASYSKDGFTVNPKISQKDKFSDDYLNYFSTIPTLIAFLSYAETKNVYPLYDKEYLLDKEDERLSELELVNRKIKEMFGEGKLDSKLIYDFVKQMQEERGRLKQALKDNEEKHQQEIINLKNEFAKEKDEICKVFNSKLSELETNKNEHIASLDAKNKELEAFLESEKKENQIKINNLNESLDEAKGTIKSLRILINPKLDEDENSEVFFDELEKEKESFDKYFDKKWKKVKKEIKRKKIQEVKEQVKEERKARKK